MQNTLKVTPEKLLEAADKFSSAEQNIRALTKEMTSIVENFKTIWQGEAATGFSNRFNALSEDMEKMYRMIREHASDLTEMANEYKNAEDESMQQAQTLVTEAFS